LNYYVYYKVDPKRLAELRESIAHLFAVVERECGVRGHWMHRRDDPATYMEIYEGVEDDAAFEAVLKREGTNLGMQRRVEVFTNDAEGKPA